MFEIANHGMILLAISLGTIVSLVALLARALHVAKYGNDKVCGRVAISVNGKFYVYLARMSGVGLAYVFVHDDLIFLGISTNAGVVVSETSACTYLYRWLDNPRKEIRPNPASDEV